jgi:uncharacterized membrane protein YfcA
VTSLSSLAGAWTVGLLIGLIGIGGIFLIPLLVAAFGLTLESAIGTSLVTFTATGCISTAIYAAKGRIDWRLAILTSIGSIVGGVVGARIGVALPGATMALVFAAFLLFAGVSAIVRSFEHGRDDASYRRLAAIPALAVGTIVGVGSGLTGVGGPAILVPLLLLLRIPATVAIAASQPNGIAASASGALGHVLYGHVVFPVAAWLIAVVGVGVVVGSLLHRRFSARALQPLIGGACVVLAIWTILHRVNAT